MAKKFFIIDGHSHIYAAYYAPMRPLTSPSGEPTKAVYIFTSAVMGLIQNQKPDMLVVAMDSKTPSFRTKLYKEYKAHRPPMPDDMPAQIARIEQVLDALNVPIVRIDGFEADDAIGTIAKSASAEGAEVLICSKDKDMLQLLDDNIYIFDMKTGQRYGKDSMLAEMGIAPEQFIDVLAVQGDTSDNIPGVKDVGPKTALEWIRTYGSIENLYKHADQIKGKRGDSLRDSKDIVLLSRKLATIDCSVPIDAGLNAFSAKKYDAGKLAKIFTELGFNRLLTQLDTEGQADSQAAPAETIKQAGHTASAKTVSHNYQLVDTAEKFDFFFTELKKQRIFAIDTETTSIKAMEADLVGISFSWNPKEAFYLAIKSPIGLKYLGIGPVREKLAPILADENIKKIGQNIKYDLLVLRNAGLPVRGTHFDTMVASYCLDSDRGSHSLDNMAMDFLGYEGIPIESLIGKRGKNQLTFDMVDTSTACEYSGEDADITFQLYLYLKDRLGQQPQLQKLFEELEMPLLEVLTEIEYNGVYIDTAQLKKMSKEMDENIETLTNRIYELTGAVFNIDSPKQLADILFNKLNLKSLRTGKTMLSTDSDVLEQLSSQHPVVDLVSQYRQLSKLKNTYTDKLGSLINTRTGRLHASFNQTVTTTGRLSSSNPNLQNIPIRTALGSKVRAAFVVRKKGDCILSADYSQIELRLLAHFSKDEAMRRAFAADQDIHRFVASQIYGVAMEEVSDEMRNRCKVVNFGIIYGQGAYGLSRTIGISQPEAKRFIEDYFLRYSSIRRFMDEIIASAKRTGYAETILNRRRKIPDLNSNNANKRSQAERFAVNTVIQGSAADLIKAAMINIHRRIENEFPDVKMILQVHDELVFELPSECADEVAKWITDEMTGAIKLDVPLKVDVNCGPSWLSGK